jgi:hypothetical protein
MWKLVARPSRPSQVNRLVGDATMRLRSVTDLMVMGVNSFGRRFCSPEAPSDAGMVDVMLYLSANLGRTACVAPPF